MSTDPRRKNPFGPEVDPAGASALPLWIDGHAYLMMADAFFTVTAADGTPLRRVPLCGAEAAEVAVRSAQAALPAWHALPVETREACFQRLHELLTRFRAHLAKLLGEEAGFSHDLADAELAQALAAVAGVVVAPSRGAAVSAVLCDALAPLAGAAGCAVEALAAGWAVILKPSPKAPSALFALAELFTRAGFPAGVVNLVHGDEAIVRALCAHESVAAAAFCGGQPLADQVAAIATGSGTLFAAGGVLGSRLQADWRQCLGHPA